LYRSTTRFIFLFSKKHPQIYPSGHPFSKINAVKSILSEDVFKKCGKQEKISETYADVHESEKLAFFNSANYLEIAVNKGNAAGLFGLEGYKEKTNIQTQYMQNRLLYQTVKIYFE
jgi:hypothetical protein